MEMERKIKKLVNTMIYANLQLASQLLLHMQSHMNVPTPPSMVTIFSFAIYCQYRPKTSGQPYGSTAGSTRAEGSFLLRAPSAEAEQRQEWEVIID